MSEIEEQLRTAIRIVEASVNIHNHKLDRKSWEFRRNEMTKRDVINTLKKEIEKINGSGNVNKPEA